MDDRGNHKGCPYRAEHIPSRTGGRVIWAIGATTRVAHTEQNISRAEPEGG